MLSSDNAAILDEKSFGDDGVIRDGDGLVNSPFLKTVMNFFYFIRIIC